MTIPLDGGAWAWPPTEDPPLTDAQKRAIHGRAMRTFGRSYPDMAEAIRTYARLFEEGAHLALRCRDVVHTPAPRTPTGLLPRMAGDPAYVEGDTAAEFETALHDFDRAMIGDPLGDADAYARRHASALSAEDLTLVRTTQAWLTAFLGRVDAMGVGPDGDCYGLYQLLVHGTPPAEDVDAPEVPPDIRAAIDCRRACVRAARDAVVAATPPEWDNADDQSDEDSA